MVLVSGDPRHSWTNMRIVHIVVGIACVAFVGGAAVVGIWSWYRAPASRLFWQLLRIGQAAIVVEAILGGIWEISPHHRAHV